MPEPGISVVVVNYRTPWDLDSFCRSLYEDDTNVNYKLVIANVEPSESDREVALKWFRKPYNAESIEFGTNVGYAAAVNQAVSLGDRETVAIFNADVKLLPNCLETCHQSLVANPNWAVVGPRQTNDKGHITYAGIFGFPPAHRAWLCVDDGVRFADVLPAHSVSGAAYFVRRVVWDELTSCPVYQDQIAPNAIGAFLPTPFYFEEEWCSVHAKQHGYEIMYLGTAHCIHNWHAAVREHNMEGWANRQFQGSSQLYKRACGLHGIRCHIK